MSDKKLLIGLIIVLTVMLVTQLVTTSIVNGFREVSLDGNINKYIPLGDTRSILIHLEYPPQFYEGEINCELHIYKNKELIETKKTEIYKKLRGEIFFITRFTYREKGKYALVSDCNIQVDGKLRKVISSNIIEVI